MSQIVNIPTPDELRNELQLRAKQRRQISSLVPRIQKVILNDLRKSETEPIGKKYRLIQRSHDSNLTIKLHANGQPSNTLCEFKEDSYIPDDMMPSLVEEVLAGFAAKDWETRITNTDGLSFEIKAPK